MGIFSPYALQAGFEGSDLATQLRVKQLQEQASREKLNDEAKARMARALIGRVLQQAGVGGNGDPNAIPTSPAPGQASVPMQRGPAAQVGVGGGIGGGMPTGGDDTATDMPAPDAGPPQGGAAPPGASPETPTPSAVSAPAPGPAAQPQRMPLSWQQVAEEVRKRTDAPPEVIFSAMQQIMPELEKESARTAKADMQKAALAQKQQALADTLRWRYVNTDSQVEKEQIRAQMKQLTTEMQDTSREKVAGMNNTSREGIAAGQNASREGIAAGNNTSRETVAGLNNARAIYVSDTNNRTKEDIANDANDLKKELTSRKLDIDQVKVDDLMAVKQRSLDLQAQGMDKKDAQFYAKLDATNQIAQMRDGTTRRGQDMVSADKQAAIAGKIDAVRGKAATGAGDAVAGMDGLISDINGMLQDPNLDKSVGARVAHMPGFLNQDVQNFRDKLNSLKSEKLVALVQQLRSTGSGTGFGRITNFEAQQLQNSMASLADTQDPEQFRQSLLKFLNGVSASKARILKGYQSTYGAAKGTGGAGVPVAQPGAGTGISTPAAVAQEPDGTVFEMGGKRYSKQGAKSVPVQ